jgi:hypothetical protein
LLTHVSGLPDGFHPWTFTQARDAPDVAAAAQRFEAHAANPAAARTLTTWLREHSLDHGPSVYIRLIDGEVAPYVALQSAAVRLRRDQAQRLTPPTAIDIPASAIAVVEADEFERARVSAETRAFWAEVDRAEARWAAAGLDHPPNVIELP